jgi:hypothetical protein
MRLRYDIILFIRSAAINIVSSNTFDDFHLSLQVAPTINNTKIGGFGGGFGSFASGGSSTGFSGFATKAANQNPFGQSSGSGFGTAAFHSTTSASMESSDKMTSGAAAAPNAWTESSNGNDDFLSSQEVRRICNNLHLMTS